MTGLGRNQPCHCGSGKKYKKCCLRKDEDTRYEEQDKHDFDYALRHGLIDPLASDEDWQDGPDPEWDEGNFPDIFENGPVCDDWYDDELDDEFEDNPEISPHFQPYELAEHLSAEDKKQIKEWWDVFDTLSQPRELAAHISGFMDEQPLLVKELGLENEPIYRLEHNCVDRMDYQCLFDLLSRLQEDFPDAYTNGFPGYDRFMVLWQLVEGKKEHVARYLERFCQDPNMNPQEVSEVIVLMASNNCQGMLADFLPDIIEEVLDSPFQMESEEILHQAVTLIMAPFLAGGLQSFRAGELVKKLEPLRAYLSSWWFDEEILQGRVERLLGVVQEWRLDTCATYLEALRLYDDVTSSFIGWLHRNKSLDWCAAAYFGYGLRSYFYEALPADKKPLHLFPVHGADIAVMFHRLEGQYYFSDDREMLRLLHAIYWFVEFLAELQVVDPEVIGTSKEICREIFELFLKETNQDDLNLTLWSTFPRIY